MPLILVVDDQAEARKPLMKLLKLEGYQVVGAANALEALAMARNEHPDLVLLDVMLPPMDGLTVLMLMREDPKLRQVPVILLTGLCDEHTVNRARELGVKDHLIKAQVTPEQLLEAVRRHVAGAEASAQSASA
jgi:CheY-like chemotaxis protein